jgi:DNA-binding Lrp family transcriptional regulator
MKYDDIDVKLLQAMRSDSRAKLLEYTQRTGIPKSTVHDRVRKLSSNGVRCTTLFHWESLGCPFRAFFIIPADETVLEYPCVNSCVRLAPEHYLLECFFSTALAFEEFKAAHPGKCYPVVATLKREGFSPSTPLL